MKHSLTEDKKFPKFSNISSEEWKKKILDDLKKNSLTELEWHSPEDIIVKPFYHTPGKIFNVIPHDKLLLIESRIFESKSKDAHKAAKKAIKSDCTSLFFENLNCNELIVALHFATLICFWRSFCRQKCCQLPQTIMFAGHFGVFPHYWAPFK
ncbi:MAG TPA: hypothetical protein EYQ86_04195 [Bacteroidetes bacterium]|nr:hypothetical protein [Bacteroidota bacterium]